MNILIIIILIIPPLILTFNSPEIVNGHGDSCSYSYGFTVLAIYGAAYVIIFVFFSWKLRSVIEGFYIKAELRAMGIIVLVSVFTWYIINMIFEHPLNERFPFSTLTILLGCLCGFGIIICLPLYYSYKQQKRRIYDIKSEGKKDSVDYTQLINVLKHERGYESFKKHLMKEFSVENILFWSDCQKNIELNRLVETDANKQVESNQWCVYIYLLYIVPDSAREINISYSLRKELIDIFYKYVSNINQITYHTEAIITQDFGVDIWKQSLTEILYLLEKDSFHRYITTESYKDFLNGIGKESV